MDLSPITPSASPSGSAGRRASTPEEAAKQFEEILVRQFVETMTKDLFKQSLAGDDSPGWMEGQADLQRDALTDVLAKHLTEQGRLGISELLMRQWTRAGLTPDALPTTDAPPSEPE